MKIADVVAAGAVHSWFPFIDAGDPTAKAGELLMAIEAKGKKERTKTSSGRSDTVQIYHTKNTVCIACSISTRFFCHSPPVARQSHCGTLA
jgi:hypothetical protein